MNDFERKEIKRLRKDAKKAGKNQYTTACMLVDQWRNLSVAIVQDYIRMIDSEVDNAKPNPR